MKKIFNLIFKLNCSNALIFSLMMTIMIISTGSLSSEIKAQNTINRNFTNNNATTNSLLNLNGSLPVLQITTQALLSHLNTTMNEATLKALNEIGKKSIALTNTLDIVKGFLAYKVIVIDANGNLHEVLVDSGDGKVLFSGTNIIDKNLVPSFLSSNQLADNNLTPASNMNNP